MTWAENLVEARRRSGIRQSALAELIGLQPTRISRWERGAGTPNVFQGVALARALCVTVESIFDVEATSVERPRITAATVSTETTAIEEVIEMLGPREALRRLIMLPPAEASDLGPAPEHEPAPCEFSPPQSPE